MSLAAPDVGLGMAIPDIDPIRIWCDQELVLLRRQMELVLGGKTGTYERDDHGRQIDTSGQTVKQLEMKITALQSLLASTQTAHNADLRAIPTTE
jgi:hypothetical protein